MEVVIQYEREEEGKRVWNEKIERIYKKVDSLKQKHEEKRLMLKRSLEESIPLHERLDRKVDDYFTLYEFILYDNQ